MVITVALVLTGLLLPALSQLRENAHRVVCSSQLRQIGVGTFMYVADFDALPFSWYLKHPKNAQELMQAHRGGAPQNWEGLGLLFKNGYCNAPACYYCPSHRGEHTVDRYLDRWYDYGFAAPTDEPEGAPVDDGDDSTDEGQIFTNYHYAGHLDWVDSNPRSLEAGVPFILATDGLRTVQDFNHQSGLNALGNDGSVVWKDDTFNLRSNLPDVALSVAEQQAYKALWGRIGDH